MKKLAILGLGKIGSYILNNINKFEFASVDAFDITTGHNFNNTEVLTEIIKNYNGVIACTPFHLNKTIANICNQHNVDYFDLTESIDASQHIATLQNSLFIPQCGLAPGMVSIIANKLAGELETVKEIQIRVGALPQVVNNQLKYLRTWNTEGLINEYCNLCLTVKYNALFWADPLVDQEIINIDGVEFEAANTSGGIGTLANTYKDKAETVNYKTIRHPGHFHIMRVLKQELGMKKNFNTFVNLFNEFVPETNLDVVHIVINVTGTVNEKTVTKQYKKKILCTENETAIQIATGSGILAVIDSWSKGQLDGKKGLVKQEDLDYDTIINSKYAECYR